MRILSAMQSTGELHIGNYLGALQQWIELQKQGECIFIIVDLHAITIDYDPKKMQKRIFDIALDYLAAGVDPRKSIIFIQSHIKEHAELAWLLSTITPIGELQRMTQFKEKSKQHEKNINAGLLSYPVLMAADILLYKTNIVPVGEDQSQHIELARTIAKKFNNKFGETFPLPKTYLSKSGARIKALCNPKKEMAKSLGSQNNIYLTDSPNKIREKIKKAVTDTEKEIKHDEKNKPAISNLLNIYHLFSNKEIKDIEKQYKGKGYGEFKKDLAEVIIKALKPFQEKRKKYEKNPKLVEQILIQGAKKAEKIAKQTMKQIKTKMGLI
ncbi:tryptophan--tRNA ligase [Patescibacteria group bacterium]|nr:tryptophan--tRNA ligase [Patescibacteria group bacterium]